MDDWKRPEDRVLPTLADLLRRWQGRRLLGGREEVDIGAEVQTVRDGFLACRARAEAAERDNARLRESLEQVEAWNIQWAEGLDINVDAIEAIVGDALRAQPGEQSAEAAAQVFVCSQCGRKERVPVNGAGMMPIAPLAGWRFASRAFCPDCAQPGEEVGG